MLSHRILRGPLTTETCETIVAQYNRLAHARIPVVDFRRWVEESPGGPALHSLLENEDGAVVGHCCLFPLPMRFGSEKILGAKAEYLFLSEQFRSDTVAGFDQVGKPAALILVETLYAAGKASGWDPIVVSSVKPVDALHRLAGCRYISFQLYECLFVTRPVRAALSTPNLSPLQRAAVFLLGVVQTILALLHVPRILSRFRPQGQKDSSPSPNRPGEALLSFFASCPSWRFPEPVYVQIRDGTSAVVVKRTARDYIRVCQSEVASGSETGRIVRQMFRILSRAPGLRWAIYSGSSAVATVAFLRRCGFVCVSRTRKFQLYTSTPEFLDPNRWDMNDSFFSFDN